MLRYVGAARMALCPVGLSRRALPCWPQPARMLLHKIYEEADMKSLVLLIVASSKDASLFCRDNEARHRCSIAACINLHVRLRLDRLIIVVGERIFLGNFPGPSEHVRRPPVER